MGNAIANLAKGYTPAGGIASALAALAAADSALSSSISGKESAIAAGTTAQYWRGDKTWQALDKTAVVYSRDIPPTLYGGLIAGGAWIGSVSSGGGGSVEFNETKVEIE